MRWYKTPWLASKLYRSCHFRKDDPEGIYLTFDDGPDPTVTRWVLDQMKSINGHATFFAVGSQLKKHKDVALEIIAAGHTLANHSFSHLKGWKTGTQKYEQDVRQMEAELGKLTAAKKLFRPPNGRIKRSQMRSLRDFEIYLWSHISWDFDTGCDISKSIAHLKQARPGSVVLMHDTKAAFSNLEQILPEVLTHYQSRGLKMKAL